jgi:hypothetical protein
MNLQTISIALLVSMHVSLTGQNLVPNPSFEENILNPFNPPCFQIPCCTFAQPLYWSYANIAYWPSLGGTIHYLTCDMNYCTNDEYPIPYQGVPVHNYNGAPYTPNGYYYQKPKDGCAYIIF